MAFGPNRAPGRNVTRLSKGMPRNAKSIFIPSHASILGKRLKVLKPPALCCNSPDGSWFVYSFVMIDSPGNSSRKVLLQTNPAWRFFSVDGNITRQE